jgi:hypothetical protein
VTRDQASLGKMAFRARWCRLGFASVIPQTWIEHRRAEDNELVGYLRPVDDAPGQYIPVTVFGYALGEPTDEYDAQQILESVGLSCLADRWLLTPDGRSEPISVQIVEASPLHLVVKTVDFGYEGDIGTTFVLDVPPNRLRGR